MTTVINNPGGGDGEGSGVGVVVGILVALLVIVLFFVYALPAIRNGNSNDNGGIDVKVDLPGNDNSGGSGY